MAGKPEPKARAIVIHGIGHARAALAAAEAEGVPVTLLSASGAAAYAGAAWFEQVIALAARDHPDARWDAVLDCGVRAGDAMAALRHGLKAIRFTGKARERAKITALARRYGATVEAPRGPALDLEHAPDPHAACVAFLSSFKNC
jgi:fructose/tagatose bisphosphate aldolase